MVNRRIIWLKLLTVAALLCVTAPLLLTMRDAAQEAQQTPVKRQNNPVSARVPLSFRALANEHFRVSFPPQLSPADAEKTLQILDKAREDMAQRLGDAAQIESVPRVEVILYVTTGDFTVATGQPAWAGGSTHSAIIELQPLQTLRQRGILETTLRHEYAHAVIESLKTAPVPRWLNEGVALDFAGEGARLSPNAKLRESSEKELDERLERISTAAEQQEVYAECYRRVAELKQAKGYAQLWQMIAG